jgi:putative transposase
MVRHQLAVAERERPKARARLTWPDRAWLALLAGTVPAERLAAMWPIVTPGTILRWHRDIVRRRWRAGRAGAVPGALPRTARSGHRCCGWPGKTSRGATAGSTTSLRGSASRWRRPRSGRSSRTPGSSPAPRRDGPDWAEFLRSQAQGILALDFFTADLLNGTKVCVLAVIEHGTRRVRILGATGHRVQFWVVQQARNLLMDLEDAGMSVKFILHDRDATFTAAFDAVF